MTKKEFREKVAALQAERANLEGAEREAITQKIADLTADFNAERAEREAGENKKPIGERFREMLREIHGKREQREITFGVQGEASGAVELKVEDIVPNLEEGTGLPEGLTIVTGVTGNQVYPIDASDMEMEEAGEIEVLADQTIDFDKLEVVARRITLGCEISYRMLDNFAKNILGHVQKKFAKAWRKYLAKKVYSQAEWDGNKGPYSGLSPKGAIKFGEETAQAILSAIAEFANHGLDMDSLCLTIDAPTEAILKLTPKAKGEGAGFVIENGKLLGYPYTVTHYINTKLNAEKTALVLTTPMLGIGIWQYFKVQTHGQERFGIDAQSKAMMKKACIGLVFNSEVSMTNLSNEVRDEDGNRVECFALYNLIGAGVTISGVAASADGKAVITYSNGATVTLDKGSVINGKVVESATVEGDVAHLTYSDGTTGDITVTPAVAAAARNTSK